MEVYLTTLRFQCTDLFGIPPTFLAYKSRLPYRLVGNMLFAHCEMCLTLQAVHCSLWKNVPVCPAVVYVSSCFLPIGTQPGKIISPSQLTIVVFGSLCVGQMY